MSNPDKCTSSQGSLQVCAVDENLSLNYYSHVKFVSSQSLRESALSHATIHVRYILHVMHAVYTNQLHQAILEKIFTCLLPLELLLMLRTCKNTDGKS